MKVTTINLLRGGVFSLAVVAAFAFTQPTPEFQDYYGLDDNNILVDVTDVVATGEYSCPDNPGTHCLYLSNDIDDPAPGAMNQDRKFSWDPEKSK
ncbi:hypothetical protein SYJ56_25665 [Algoriphagus sp. D3-2-R+10]|uniref:hypothetical protein n=1 Tax=Algoriphagus aurantiacus TaxID=3103948 RepID=UPI002B38EA0E|nr:hypothetical protein [Algoriphagus sp. D3-2-R+10]MEB2778722.1 hypothetical protein [Algoriphagus sp. D3-2-R+10]